MPDTPTVLFVCLHGAAKSVIAEEHFRRLAAERGLRVTAHSAGVEPDDAIPPRVLAGLAADGIAAEERAPRALSSEALRDATYVVSFGCDLSALAPERADVERWDDVPMVSDGYEAARSAIVARVSALVAGLAAERAG